METVTTHQFKTELPRQLAAVKTGGEFVITKGKRPVAKLVPIGLDQNEVASKGR